MTEGFTLTRDSLIKLSRLLKERNIGNQLLDGNVKDTWPTCSAARVTEAITARNELTPGKGKIVLLTAREKPDTPTEYEIKKPEEENAPVITVFRIGKSPSEVAVDKEGYVIQDAWGNHWWLESDGGSRRANAVLDADMTPADDFVSVVSIEPIEGAGDTEPIDVANVCRWYGITGNKCKIEYNPNFDNGEGEEKGGWELYAIEVNYTLECPVLPPAE
jgi:hypothetical protein